MKNIYFTTLFFFSFIAGNYAQNSFPTDSAIWANRYQMYYFDNSTSTLHITVETYTKYCLYGTDTTINAANYNEIYTCTAFDSSYHGAIRENSGQVFFVPADSTTEFLLYDFTLNVGDSVEVILLSSYQDEYIIRQLEVQLIDSGLVNGSLRKRISFGGYSWIEGIGCTSGLFMEPYSNVSNYFLDLMCFSIDDTTVYTKDQGPLAQGIQGACDLFLSLPDQPMSESKVQVFPNPTSGCINIEIEDQTSVLSIRIYNHLGEIISTFDNKKNNLSFIDIEGSAGIYFMEIQAQNGSKTTRKIVKI